MADVVPAVRPLAEDFVKEVNLDLNDIKHSFFRIGFRLSEACENAYFRDLGFDNIADCAEALFGFKKTTTYDLMLIYSRYHNRAAPMFIDKPYDKYSQSQLLALCSVRVASDTFFSYVSPTDTVDTIKKASKIWNGLYLGRISKKYNVRYTTLQEFIDIYSPKEPIVLPASTVEYIVEAPVTDSGYPENGVENSVYTENEQITPSIVAESIDENSGDISPDNSKNIKELYLYFSQILEKCINDSGYKISFIDSKGMPLRVLPDHASKAFIIFLFAQIYCNSVPFKNWIKQIVFDELSKYDYKILLCGREQALNAFCGNIGTFVCDAIINEYLEKFPEKEKKKRR